MSVVRLRAWCYPSCLSLLNSVANIHTVWGSLDFEIRHERTAWPNAVGTFPATEALAEEYVLEKMLLLISWGRSSGYEPSELSPYVSICMYIYLYT